MLLPVDKEQAAGISRRGASALPISDVWSVGGKTIAIPERAGLPGREVVNKLPRGCAVIQRCRGSSAIVRSSGLRLRLAK
jgi:hypothetical protein